jgi:hypothetical protein
MPIVIKSVYYMCRSYSHHGQITIIHFHLSIFYIKIDQVFKKAVFAYPFTNTIQDSTYVLLVTPLQHNDRTRRTEGGSVYDTS